MIDPCRAGLRAGALLLGAASVAMITCEREAAPSSAASSEWQEFEGSWNASGTRHTIPLGAERRGSIIDLSGTMALTGSGRPGVGFRAEFIALVDTETGLVGRGVWTDEHGDRVFTDLKGESVQGSNHIAGTFLGGTGRYAGATGTFEFSWQFMIELDDGSIQGRATDLKGRFRLGDAQPEGAAR